MRLPRNIAWVVATDFVLTYPYVFAANALPFEHSGPAASSTYWMTQMWVYALIVPVAAIAAWRGARQFQRMRRGQDSWWRLPAEAATRGATPVVFIALVDQAAVFRAILEGAALSAGLGLLLGAANTFLDRIGPEDSEPSMPASLPAV